MQIPFFNYPQIYLSNKNNYIKKFNEVCSRGSFILQKDLENFEQNLKNFLNAKYCIGVANGTDAIWLGLIASGIKAGDEIIIPSHTYVATAAAIKFVGAIPVLCNCQNDGMIDFKDIEQRITKKTVGIMPVQLNGRSCNMNEIENICKKHKLKLFVDSAQGLGSKFNSKHSSTFGLFGTISFYPAKLLGCFGDGGALVTNKKKIAEKVFKLRDHGRDKSGKVKDLGYNSRLDNLQAAFLNLRLKNFKKEINRRRKIAKIYENNLNKIKQLKLPPKPNESEKNFDVYQNYEIQAENRDKLKNFLKKNGVGTLIQWGGYPLHKIKSLKLKFKNLNKTDNYFRKCLMLPMHSFLTDREIKYICSKINKFYEN